MAFDPAPVVPGTSNAVVVTGALAPRLRKVLARNLGKKLLGACRQLLDEDDALRTAKKRGRTARAVSSVKKKGREGVMLARSWLLRLIPALAPDDILIQTTSVGGSDLHFSPTAAHRFPFAPESKRVQHLNVWGALHQAEVNARKKGLPPVLFFSRNNGPLYVAFKADDLGGWLSQLNPHHFCYSKDTDGDGTGRSDQVTPEAGSGGV